MDRWKSRGGKSQRRESEKEEDQRRERVRRKKIQVCEKVEKSRNTVFSTCFVASEGRRVGLLKRRVRSHLGRWEMKNCTPLWREAHVEVKTQKKPHCRSTFGSWDVEKVHALVARSTLKTPQCRSAFGSWDVEKAHAVVAWSTFPSQNVKSTTCSRHFWTLKRCLVWQAQRILHPVKSE